MDTKTIDILCVDNYDSFVHTIVSYVRKAGAHVDVVRNDDPLLADVLRKKNDRYQAILVSPGPGYPADAGYSPAIIEWCINNQIPFFGVCLGHQGLGEVCGARVYRAPMVMHGKTSLIQHDGQFIFQGIENPVQVTRYHSLALDPQSIPHELIVTARSDDGMIMGLRHRNAPAYSVQFHPESIATHSGYHMIENWISLIRSVTQSEIYQED